MNNKKNLEIEIKTQLETKIINENLFKQKKITYLTVKIYEI